MWMLAGCVGEESAVSDGGTGEASSGDAYHQPDTQAPDTTVPEASSDDSTSPEGAGDDSTSPEATADDSSSPEAASDDSTVPEGGSPEASPVDSTAPDTGADVGAEAGPKPTRGDVNGDGKGDLALTGGVGWNSVPVAFSNGDGSFRVTNSMVANFPTYAAQTGARPGCGDINGDGLADLVLTGGVGWNTVPVAFSMGDGSFRVTNTAVANFPIYATQGSTPVVEDFDHDGKADIALTGGPGWGTIPVAFSNGDGSFKVTNLNVANFPTYAAQTGAKPVAGDFNGDGRADLALTGGVGWGTVPVAFSNGDGTFNVTNTTVANFPVYATQGGAVPVAGDFNGDGKEDIALSGGGPGWNSIPVAFSNGDGSFNVTNTMVPNFPVYATQSGAQLVAADFDGDDKADLALTGGAGWATIPVAFSNGDGSFRVTNTNVANFPVYATQPGAKPVSASEQP
jgi:hypothetical protein